MNKIRNIIPLFSIMIVLIAHNYAGAASTEELAKAAQNPIANMISLPLQNNTNTGIGPDDETQNILNIQPVIPVSLTDDWLMITRTILPVISQPDILTHDGRVRGLGDTTFSAFFSPKKSSITWGVGPVLLLPTATDDTLGADKWGAGPSAIFLAMPGNWVIGSMFSNIWSVGGAGDNDINLFTCQYFINYNLPNGWYLTSAPINTANWEADSDNRWTIPIGGGVGKIFRIGKLPINGQISAYKNIESPENGADWQFRVQLQFMFPK